ncbi:MAG: hypothetical protein ACK47B_03650 [Armatimonadota bacterium]
MDPGVVIVSVVGTLAVYRLAKQWIETRGKSGVSPGLSAEVAALRQEVQQLKQQNNDLLLTVDNSLDRMDRRVSHLETRLAGPAEERQQIGSGR